MKPVVDRCRESAGRRSWTSARTGTRGTRCPIRGSTARKDEEERFEAEDPIDTSRRLPHARARHARDDELQGDRRKAVRDEIRDAVEVGGGLARARPVDELYTDVYVERWGPYHGHEPAADAWTRPARRVRATEPPCREIEFRDALREAMSEEMRARPARLPHGRGGRGVQRRLQGQPRHARRVRPAARDRHADLRDRVRRPGHRRRDDGPAADRRVHELVVQPRRRGPDPQQRAEDALHVRRPVRLPDRLPRQRRRGRPARLDALLVRRGSVRQRARPQDGDPLTTRTTRRGSSRPRSATTTPCSSSSPSACSSTKGEVPEEEYTIPFGQAIVRRRGTDCTIVSFGRPVYFCLEAAEDAGEGRHRLRGDRRADDPAARHRHDRRVACAGRTTASSWTSRGRSRSPGSEIAAQVHQHCFDDLDNHVAPRAQRRRAGAVRVRARAGDAARTPARSARPCA